MPTARRCSASSSASQSSSTVHRCRADPDRDAAIHPEGATGITRRFRGEHRTADLQPQRSGDAAQGHPDARQQRLEQHVPGAGVRAVDPVEVCKPARTSSAQVRTVQVIPGAANVPSAATSASAAPASSR